MDFFKVSMHVKYHGKSGHKLITPYVEAYHLICVLYYGPHFVGSRHKREKTTARIVRTACGKIVGMFGSPM